MPCCTITGIDRTASQSTCSASHPGANGLIASTPAGRTALAAAQRHGERDARALREPAEDRLGAREAERVALLVDERVDEVDGAR